MAVALVALAAISVPSLGVLGTLVTTDRYIVSEESTVTEDQYVSAMSAIVEGVIDGDLTIFTGSLLIAGEVTGSVTVFASGPVTIADTGSVGGSVNGAGTSLNVRGRVGSDVFFAGGSVVIEDGAEVGRDVMAFGGTARVEGSVDRDVRGRVYRTTIDGDVAGDVDLATQSLAVGADATVGGDVLYRSSSDAVIASGATIGGTVTKLPAQGNFVYGIVLALANIVGLLGFLVAGLVALWIMRGTGSRAVGAMLTHPVKSLVAGVATVITVPLLVVVLAITLVGIPIAIALGAACIVGFIIGAVPAVTALGNRVLVNRGGVFGAFLVGAVLWRLGIWLIPVVGGALFVLGVVWGIGAWVLGALASRRAEPIVPALLPASLTVAAEAPPVWEPPLAPGHVRTRAGAVPEGGPTSDGEADETGDGGMPSEPGDGVDGPTTTVGPDVTPSTWPRDEVLTFTTAGPPAGVGEPAIEEGGEEDVAEAADATAALTLEDRLRQFRAELEQPSSGGGESEPGSSRPVAPMDDERDPGVSMTDGGPGRDEQHGDDAADDGETGRTPPAEPDDGWGLPTR